MIDETAEEIREMRTHSSSVVATKAARALTALVDREFATVEEYEQSLERNSRALVRANPVHASLVTSQRDIRQRIGDADPDTVAAAKAATEEAIETVVSDLETAKGRAAAELADHLDDGDTVLTHDYSTTVLGGIRRAVEEGTSLTVYATESRPLKLGRRMARTLGALDGVDARLLVDGASGYVLADCDRVVVGMTCLVENTLYNRVGTYPIAATAADAGVPVTVAGASSKVVVGGFRFENEQRPAVEVIREPPDGFEVENRAYDATPLRLVDAIITEDGVESP